MSQQPPLDRGEPSDQDAFGDASRRLRQDILSSWKRSMLAGLDPGAFKVPHQPDVDHDSPLTYAANPVMARVAADLADTGIGIVLADAQGHVISRVAERSVLSSLDRIELARGALYGESDIGTNAIGTAAAEQRPALVTGAEHFAVALDAMACAACPITDSAGRFVGVIDLTCAARDFNPLMLPLVKRTAAEIGLALEPSRETSREISREAARQRPGQPGALSDGVAVLVPGWSNLTPTQRVVAELAADGLTNRGVAERLFLSPHTVDFHLRQIYRRLGVSSRLELARMAERAVAAVKR
jgi:transcriptional regulator of acetoin/glycerol metabolism